MLDAINIHNGGRFCNKRFTVKVNKLSRIRKIIVGRRPAYMDQLYVTENEINTDT